QLSQALFVGGIDGLLQLSNQEIDELPTFTFQDGQPVDAIVRVKPDRVQSDRLPVDSSLEFRGANGLYYWELFYHAPALIAQSLNTVKKFAEAKRCYEYIFDPPAGGNYWKFLPFLAVDAEKGLEQIKTYLDDPFDPHAIAALRSLAYRRTTVMAYI